MSTRQMKLCWLQLCVGALRVGKLSLTPVSILKYSYCPLRLTIFPYLEFTAVFFRVHLQQLPFSSFPIDKYVDK